MKKRTMKKIADGVLSLIMGIYCACTAYLILFVFITSFKTKSDFFKNTFGFPKEFILDNFIEAWTTGKFSLYYKNSIIITVSAVIFSCVIASMGAYGIARYKFKFKKLVFTYFIIGLMFPIQLEIIPIFILVRDIGLVNTRLSVILIYAASVSFPIFIFAEFFKTIPYELEECARIDGAKDFMIYWRIILPITRPALATVVIFLTILFWNDMFIPMIFLREDGLKTIPLGMLKFFGQMTTNWLVVFAGTTIALFPIVVVYFIGSKQFIKGLTAGAIKG